MGFNPDEAKLLLAGLTVRESADSAFVRAADNPYAAPLKILTIAPRSGKRGLQRCRVNFDLQKTTVGWVAKVTGGDTLRFLVKRYINGTHARIVSYGGAFTSNALTQEAPELDLGMITPTETVEIFVLASANRSVEIDLPYRVVWTGDTLPTITPRTTTPA